YSARMPDGHPAGGDILDGVRERFELSTDFTVGIEEEYQILDPSTLALTNRGTATTAALLALAREIRDGVQKTFGITLRPEPVFLGFDNENPLD
ncbi:MAG: hypothetical protein MUP13_15895, partial [Thermoanaerobaculales bacterium]|nr:hypothetical protein [Thermoanaerobaculales bacterium]